MIRVRSLTRKYGTVTAVKSLNFEVPTNQVVGLLGHNGAGKTTTLKMLTGFLEPSEGQVLIKSYDIQHHTLKARSLLGYLPEQSPLYPEMTVVEYLFYVAKLRGVSYLQQKQLVEEAVKDTMLEDKAYALINTLSKGYKQRVGVAQAILHKPKFLILDEPTSGLDPSQILAMRKLIRKLAESSTIIISTHIMQEVEAMCDRVLIIRQGELALDSHLSDLRRNELYPTILRPRTKSHKETLQELPRNLKNC